MKKQHREWEKTSAIHVSDKACFRTHTHYKMGKRPEWALRKKGQTKWTANILKGA